MTTLEHEQMDDLKWATDVLQGNGQEDDNRLAASNMLTTLAEHGATAEIRASAAEALVPTLTQVA